MNKTLAPLIEFLDAKSIGYEPDEKAQVVRLGIEVAMDGLVIQHVILFSHRFFCPVLPIRLAGRRTNRRANSSGHWLCHGTILTAPQNENGE